MVSPGILGADEVREGHRDAFGGGEAVLAVEDHGVRAVEQDNRRAGRLVVGPAGLAGRNTRG